MINELGKSRVNSKSVLYLWWRRTISILVQAFLVTRLPNMCVIGTASTRDSNQAIKMPESFNEVCPWKFLNIGLGNGLVQYLQGVSNGGTAACTKASI